MTLTLFRSGSPLSDSATQRRLLEANGNQIEFNAALAAHGAAPLRACGIEVLQVNLGKLCNQTCRHCHVDAGPDRREIMSRETISACLRALERGKIPTLDITG